MALPFGLPASYPRSVRHSPAAGCADRVAAAAAAWRRSCRNLKTRRRDRELRELPVSLIKPNPSQPRANFDEGALAGLAASIEATGVVQPLLVRPLPDGSYELVAGEAPLPGARPPAGGGFEKLQAVVRDQAEAEQAAGGADRT